MKLSIIIPVFNEEKTIAHLLHRVDRIAIPGVTKEIIVVNDGSNDGTLRQINNLKFIIKNFLLINHEINSGKGKAILTGIKHASGDYIVIQDGDLEYDPKDIVRLIAPIKSKQAKVVYGTRLKRLPHFSREEKTLRFIFHYLGNRFLSFLTSVLYGQWLTDMETCYKLFPKSAIDNMQCKGFEFEPEITAKLLKAGYRITEIPITTIPRSYAEGKKLRTFHDGSIALWTLIKYRFVD